MNHTGRLAAEWQQFRADCISYGASVTMLEAFERAFFAGCATVLSIIDADVFDKVKTADESWLVLEGLRSEMAQYIEGCRQIIQ